MTEELPLFPLNTVLFPGMPLRLHIFELRYREMIGACADEDRPFGVVLIKEGMEVGAPADPFEVGTMAKIVGIDRLDDGRMNIVTMGTRRFRVRTYSTEKRSYVVGEVEPFDDEPAAAPTVGDLVQNVGAAAQRYVALLQAAYEQEIAPLSLPPSAEDLSYLIGGILRVPNDERQRLLELASTTDRLEQERNILARESVSVEAFLQQRGPSNLGPFSRN
ncbi:MAG: hypothetical protein GEU73_09150 [Chloroflexi bacterium]|nr:hypothetical protein [Chloroflexota bacterium]